MALTVLCVPLLLLRGGGLSAPGKAANRMAKQRTLMERDTFCYTLEHAEQMANLRAVASQIGNVMGIFLFDRRLSLCVDIKGFIANPVVVTLQNCSMATCVADGGVPLVLAGAQPAPS